MNTRDLTLISICIGLMVFDSFLSLTIPFIEVFAIGLMLYCVSLKVFVKATTVITFIRSIRMGMIFGLVPSIGYAVTYFIGVFALCPLAYYVFKKYKLKERIGYQNDEHN